MLTSGPVDLFMNPTSTAQEWPTSTVISLATLILMVIMAPTGWLVRRYCIKEGQLKIDSDLQEIDNNLGAATSFGTEGEGSGQRDIELEGMERDAPLFISGVFI